MTRVTNSRQLDGSPSIVREVIVDDLAAFLAAGGYDSVEVDGDRIELANQIGFATLELTLQLDPDADAILAFEAVSGIFDRMRTEYTVTETDSGSEITAWTDFTLGGVIGSALDETLITRQRNREFDQQFDYLAAELETRETDY